MESGEFKANPEPSLYSNQAENPAESGHRTPLSRLEKLAVAASYILAWIYTGIIYSDPYQTIWLAAFTLLFIAAVETVFYSQRASAESRIWLVSMLVILVSGLGGRSHVWGQLYLPFLHLFAIYYVLNRSARMAEGRSSRYFVLDAVNGALIFPFRHFFLRIRTLWTWLFRQSRRKLPGLVIAASILAVLAAGVGLLVAAVLLGEADPEFGRIMLGLVSWIRLDNLVPYVFRFLVSLPVGAYLYGLVMGTREEKQEQIQAQVQRGEEVLASLRVVPGAVWTVLVSLFAMLYIVFFIMQGSYLFSALQGTLPEGFTYAEYARRGFFELCLIMGLNLALLWFATRTSDRRLRDYGHGRSAATAILGESVLFAVIAFAKLVMYISAYGFTPLRLQSSWLVLVLLAGCLAWLMAIWRKKETARAWVIFSGVTLALLHIF